MPWLAWSYRWAGSTTGGRRPRPLPAGLLEIGSGTGANLACRTGAPNLTVSVNRNTAMLKVASSRLFDASDHRASGRVGGVAGKNDLGLNGPFAARTLRGATGTR